MTHSKKKVKSIISLATALLLAAMTMLMATACSGQSGQDQGAQETQEYIGIISAMENEADLLIDEAEIDHTDTIGGVEFNVGTLAGHPVVIAKAGVGKVLAAAGTAAMLNNYNISKLIFTGIAGGVGDETKVLDQVIATKLVQHDYGTVTNDGFQWTGGEVAGADEAAPGENGFVICDEALVEAAYKASVDVVGEEHTFKGVIATGDQFISSSEYVDKLQNDFNAIACEMEGAAVAAVCGEYDIPFVVIRSMSDKADGEAHETVENMRDLAADNSSKIVIKMLEDMQ